MIIKYEIKSYSLGKAVFLITELNLELCNMYIIKKVRILQIYSD